MTDWVDITRTLGEWMLHWPGDTPFQWRRIASVDPDGYNLSELKTTVHIGTHIDAPRHYVADGADVASIDLDILCGPAVVIDHDQPRDVRVEDLRAAGVGAGERVLLRTLNRHLWFEPEFQSEFNAVTPEAARWLVEQRVALLGVDYLSPETGSDPDMPVHRILLGAGIPIIEGLDLDRVAAGRYEMVALPLKIAGGEGAPARVILGRRDLGHRG